MTASLQPFFPFKTVILVSLLALSADLKSQDYLQLCWENQVADSQEFYVQISYEETLNELHHSFQPWQQSAYTGVGKLWYDGRTFLKEDSLKSSRRGYVSLTEYRPNELLMVDYGDEELLPIDYQLLVEFPIKTARYSPALLLQLFNERHVGASHLSSDELAQYTTTIGKSVVTLSIRTSDALLQDISVLSDDELFGDVLTVFNYSDYVNVSSISIPRQIAISKVDGHVMDTVLIKSVSLSSELPDLIERPADYALQEARAIQPEITSKERFEGIHLIEMTHTDDRVLVVEFDEFLLVAEAPINSANGEYIIDEAKKIAPNKPIKYFVYGHYHSHYLGGIRPFVHEGAEVICSKKNEDYMRYIVESERSVNPDRLALDPKPLIIKEIKDSLTISDGEREMNIYLIGEQSAHTNDYLIYYFPEEKLLFQDDLIWIKEDGPVKKAGARQAGLYEAIASLGLDVDLIIQSWPVSGHGVMTEIPFEDLEKSMLVQ